MDTEQRDQLAAVLYTAVAEGIVRKARKETPLRFMDISEGDTVNELKAAARLSLVAADIFYSELHRYMNT